MFRQQVIILSLVLALIRTVGGAVTCAKDYMAPGMQRTFDIVLLVDTSADSMAPYIAKVRSELSWFVTQTLSNQDPSAAAHFQIALIKVGGSSTMLVPLTTDREALITAINNLRADGDSREPSLEAYRTALESHNFVSGCSSVFPTSQCMNITWRADSKRVGYLFTDEGEFETGVV
jgi:hypothetical protein